MSLRNGGGHKSSPNNKLFVPNLWSKAIMEEMMGGSPAEIDIMTLNPTLGFLLAGEAKVYLRHRREHYAIQIDIRFRSGQSLTYMFDETIEELRRDGFKWYNDVGLFAECANVLAGGPNGNTRK